MYVAEKIRVITAVGLQMPMTAPKMICPCKLENFQTTDQVRNKKILRYYVEQEMDSPTWEKEWLKFQPLSHTGSAPQHFQEYLQKCLL